MVKYEIIKNDLGEINSIKRINQDGSQSYIPTDPANSDYQAYLASLEAPTV
jgi:hypothetical protein